MFSCDHQFISDRTVLAVSEGIIDIRATWTELLRCLIYLRNHIKKSPFTRVTSAMWLLRSQIQIKLPTFSCKQLILTCARKHQNKWKQELNGKITFCQERWSIIMGNFQFSLHHHIPSQSWYPDQSKHPHHKVMPVNKTTTPSYLLNISNHQNKHAGLGILGVKVHTSWNCQSSETMVHTNYIYRHGISKSPNYSNCVGNYHENS